MEQKADFLSPLATEDSLGEQYNGLEWGELLSDADCVQMLAMLDDSDRINAKEGPTGTEDKQQEVGGTEQQETGTTQEKEPESRKRKERSPETDFKKAVEQVNTDIVSALVHEETGSTKERRRKTRTVQSHLKDMTQEQILARMREELNRVTDMKQRHRIQNKWNRVLQRKEEEGAVQSMEERIEIMNDEISKLETEKKTLSGSVKGYRKVLRKALELLQLQNDAMRKLHGVGSELYEQIEMAKAMHALNSAPLEGRQNACDDRVEERVIKTFEEAGEMISTVEDFCVKTALCVQ